jgi:hypothetical protein
MARVSPPEAAVLADSLGSLAGMMIENGLTKVCCELEAVSTVAAVFKLLSYLLSINFFV